MKAKDIHSWHVTTAEARDIQFRIRDLVVKEAGSLAPHFVTGADISFRRDGAATSAAVTLSFPALELVESVVVEGYAPFPYVPGLLTFREAPLLLTAFERMKITPDLILVDGQGIAHPRRFGVASHLGVLLDVPTVGCAKSRLCGEHQDPPLKAPAHALLKDGAEIIGAAVRTRTGTKPVYVSIGHRVDLPAAIDLVLACCRGYRLPEPTRLAHLAALDGRLAASASHG